jgi:inner membrane protein
VDNITHSLVGATLAELALPQGATRPQRRVFFLAGIVAANLPDADLVYTWITPEPLGSLLHHRGHTHTVVGLAALALLFGAATVLPAVRGAMGSLRARWWTLVAVGLASHLVLDSWNSYGVHPFWPLDSRWFYGDAIFIADPWIWMLLGLAAALNIANKVGRIALGAALGLIVVGVTALRLMPLPAFGSLVAAAAMLWAVMRSWPQRRRAAVALALTVAYVAGMFGVRARVEGRALASLGAPRSAVADVVLSPSPANPLCWSVLTIVTDQPGDAWVSTQGSASAVGASGCGRSGPVVEWSQPVRQSLSSLRALHARDCWVRGWMQFGRAPLVAGGEIADLRYGRPGGNFTDMRLLPAEEAARCPPNLTGWTPPRADLLRGPT